jgi:hypothetical protein
MDKFVKLAAIEKMAKPMEAFHGKEESYEEKDSKDMKCVCACCGAPCEVCGEDDSEEEYEDEDEGE